MAKREITMTVSYGGDLVAGESYKLDPEQADELILKGFAEGELSREFSNDERAAVRGGVQVVSL